MNLATTRASTRSTNPRALCGAAALLIGLAVLSGCGSDDDEPATASSGSSADTGDAAGDTGAAITPDGDGEIVDELDEALGEDSGVEDALGAVGDDGLNDILGGVLEDTLGADGYSVEDGQLIFDMPGSAEDDSSDCITATLSRDGVGATAEIVLRYSDGDVVCG